MLVQNQFPLGGNKSSTENGKTYTIIFIGFLVGATIYYSYRFLPSLNKNEK
jgi:hypothetical protein